MGKELILALKPTLVGFANILEVDWTLLAGQIMVESSGNPQAKGGMGEIGLAQLFLTTAQDRIPKLTKDQLYKPEVNVIAQGMYLVWLQYYLRNCCECDDYNFVLAAYNHGIGNVKRLLQAKGTFNDLPFNVQGYVDKVYKFAEQFQGEGDT